MSIEVFFEVGREFPVGLRFSRYEEHMISMDTARRLHKDLGVVIQQTDSSNAENKEDK